MKMSVEFKAKIEKQLILQEYKAEFTVSGLHSLGTKSIRTPVFYPLPNVELGFCFTVWYQTVQVSPKSSYYSSTFKVELIKTSCFDIPKNMKIEAKADILYHNGYKFKKYNFSPAFIVDETEVINFQDVISDLQSHFDLMRAKDLLIIKCYLRFFDHLSVPSLNRYESHSSNLEKLSKDFLSVYNSSEFSDIQFNIEGQSLLAHRSILAARSPAFLKKFSQDSKTVTITDTSYELFEYFLKYLYSGEISNTVWPVLRDLIALADKYDVSTLKRDCTEKAVAFISVDKACDILDLVYRVGDRKLIDTAKKFAVAHIDQLIFKKEWNVLVTNCPVIGCEIMTLVYLSKNSPTETNLPDESK